MRDLKAQLLEQLSVMATAEVVAVVFAVLYLLLAIRQSIFCWYCAGISTALYIYLYFATNLYMESLLNVFYFFMAIYGWQKWRAGKTGNGFLRVSVWPLKHHVSAILAITSASFVSGYVLTTYTDAAFPYIDSATTFTAMWATFLVARKVLENWWYWLVVDIAYVFIYWSKDLQLTALLFGVYVIMIPFGLISWTRSWREERA